MLETIIIVGVDIAIVISGAISLYKYVKTKGKHFNNRL